MTFKKFIPLFLVLLFIQTSCKKENASVLINGGDEIIELNRSIAVTFSSDIVHDSVIGHWSSKPYLKIEPELKGVYRWEDNKTLLFSPANGAITPATEYTVKQGKGLEEEATRKLKDFDKLSFKSPSLKIEDITPRWVRDYETKESRAQVRLKLNYGLSKQTLEDHLKLSLGETEYEFDAQAQFSADQIELLIKGLALHEEDLEGSIKISDDMLLEEDRKNSALNFLMLSPLKVEILNTTVQHDGEQGLVYIYTSQPLVTEALKDHITIDPQIDFKVEQFSDHILISSNELITESTYKLTIKKGVKGVNGGALKRDYYSDITFGELSPDISFKEGNGMYLSSLGNKTIELAITAVPKVRIRITKVYENNLVSAMYNSYGIGYGSYYYDEYEIDYEDNYSSYSGYERGDVIYEEIINVADLEGNGYIKKFKFNIKDKLGSYNGIYHVMVNSVDDYWLRDTRFISVSDIGLIAKHGNDQMHVFCNSIKTTNALNNADVKVYGRNNQIIGRGKTNSEGYCAISLDKHDERGFMPALIAVDHNNDFNFLPLSDTRVNTSRYDVGGKVSNESGLECYLYPERDLYRPGETIKGAGILRDLTQNIPDNIPLRMVIRLPNGKVYKERKISLNQQASFSFEQEMPHSSPTGIYRFEVSTLSDHLLCTENILVEEFIPDRIKVSTSLSKDEYDVEEKQILKINAVNFFGPPAANRNVETEVSVNTDVFSIKGYENYIFRLDRERLSVRDKTIKKTTDEEGNATIEHQLPEYLKGNGLLETSYITTVFDENGRTVVKTNKAKVYTQSNFIGIKYSGHYYGVGQGIPTEMALVTKDGKSYNGEVTVSVIKNEYRTVLEKYGSNYRYQSQHYPVVIDRKKLKVNGKAKYTFIPSESGSYELRFEIEGQRYPVTRKLYAYNWRYSNSSSFEVNKEGNIQIVSDKNEYAPGQQAKLLFKTPFSGKMLVTVEQNKVLEYHYLDVKNRSAEISIAVKDDHLPTAYVSATLIKPHELSDIPLTVAHGYHPLNVVKKERKMDIKINASAKSRSNRSQTIEIETTPNSMVTVAVVDEGILQISGFETPDPFEAFYGKRALGVNSFDLYPYLFREVRSYSSTGGDDMGMRKALNPTNSNRVKLVSFWSGLVQASSSGKVKVDIDLPKFSGSVRIMAVAHKGNRFGSSDKQMVVADPLVQSASVPRFLSLNDSLDVNLTLSNTTSYTMTTANSIKVEGPVRIVGSKNKDLNLDANSSGSLQFKLVATNEIGEAKISFISKGNGESFTEEYLVPVRPASGLMTFDQSGELNDEEISLDPSLNSPIDQVSENTLIVGNSQLVQLKEDLQRLINYPYGCLEQTISKAFPQIYIRKLDQIMSRRDLSKANINVNDALNKIKLHETYNGGFTLWQNYGNVNWWSTIYATHFMLECKKAGYNIDEGSLQRSLNYIKNKLRSRSSKDYFYNGNIVKYVPREVAYSLYVLSLADRPDVSSMNYYKMNLDQLTTDSKYLLAASYYLAGHKNAFNSIIPKTWTNVENVRSPYGGFGSAIRDHAIMLNCLVETDIDNPMVHPLATHITRLLKGKRYISTQETAWAFLALSKMTQNAKPARSAEIYADGKLIKTVELSSMHYVSVPRNAKEVKLNIKGGLAYYTLVQNGYSSSTQQEDEDNNLMVRRELYDRTGKRIYGNNFKQNDLIIVKLSISSPLKRLDNVLLLDMLPAGFEIENSRLSAVPGMNWIKSSSRPSMKDIRDDRMIMVVDNVHDVKSYYYAVRAVSRGNFNWAPMVAESMYDADIRSSNGALKISVD